ncbi:P-loop NTPase fold protein [Sulfurimonas sp. HSL3-2]|uniref:P-loop NTPase fold protein n=1 Tax=Hydrocurvibacter mobilis TaxID=3131936 RepID=UPI0031F91852
MEIESDLIRTDGLNKEEITEKLNQLLALDNEDYKDGFVLSIDGRWGIGKTVFWKEYTKEHLIKNGQYQEHDIAYVSLFGKHSIESINSEILLKVSRKSKIAKGIDGLKAKYYPALKEINKMTYGIGGVLGSAALSILSDTDFKGKIICFDDFERLSDNISHKDIMGLISSLKEDKKCKIVMIMHQEKLGNKHNNISSYDINSTNVDGEKNVSLNFNTSKTENSEYTEYKEKIIDIELFYSPSIDSLFNIVNNKIKYEPFKEYMIKYLKDKDIKNIRVMKRMVTALNDFDFIKDWGFLHKNSKRQIAENILEISTIYALFHFIELEKLRKYTIEKPTHHLNSDKPFPIDDKLEKILHYIYYDIEYIITPITEVLAKYINTSIIDKEKLYSVVEEDSNNFKRSQLYDDIMNLGRQYLDDFSLTSKEYSEKLYALLAQDTKIISLVHPNNFLFYIEELTRIDEQNKPQYDSLLIEAGKHYIDDFFTINEHIRYYRESEYNTVISYNKELKKYAEDTYNRVVRSQLDIKDINNALENLISSHSTSSDVARLQFLTKDDCKMYLNENKDFTEISFEYLRKKSHIAEVENFRKNLIYALKELSEENNDLTYRINRMFKIAQIEDLKE